MVKLNKLLICELLDLMLNQSDLYSTQTLKDTKHMMQDYEEIIKEHISEQLFTEYKELCKDADGQLYKQGFIEGIKFLNHIIEHLDDYVSED